ncbi:MAG: NADH-quinone oxidoreductase subunit NuoK [Planctomycetaceae bacterium]
MMTGEYERFLTVGAGLFILGAIGFLTRRNLILLVLSAEMMLHGVALTLVTFSHMHHTQEGQSFTVFGLTVAACEAGLALSLVLALFQNTRSLDIELWSRLREPDLPGPKADPAEVPVEADPTLPRLPPAGLAPVVDLDAEILAGAQPDRRPDYPSGREPQLTANEATPSSH